MLNSLTHDKIVIYNELLEVMRQIQYLYKEKHLSYLKKSSKTMIQISKGKIVGFKDHLRHGKSNKA